MKTLYIILCVMIGFNLTVFAANGSKDIIIELGEDYTLPGRTDKIWVENAKIISAVPAGSGVRLKTMTLGQTLIRQNNQLIKVSVVPTGSQKTYQDWQKLSQKFLNIKVDFCDDVVCLKGKLFRFEDFKRLTRLIQENESSLYLALDVESDLKAKLNTWIENYMRENGMTPLKVVYSQPWKLLYTNKENSSDYKHLLRRIGILALENKQKIDIADNVRVEVKVTEIKKDFGRTLGMQWPQAYSAQVVDGQLGMGNTIEGFLNAKENEGQVKVLASPNLICRSGKEAEFFAGGEFPIKILNYKVQDIVWKKYGIMMKIKPLIDSIGQMSLQIESEVSSLDTSRTVDGIPGLFTNKVSSYFDLVQSKTIALSGLITNETGESSTGLPFLSQIPILGSLFASKDYKEHKSELVIFVTPQLMKND
ncbi:MAG: hypothetical protein H7256_01700 [Bdellovibrio sp.]|nr:hypothetical protein [Bdellovibrio sp.]